MMRVGHWYQLAEQILAGEEITPAQAEEILAAPDVELLELLAAAYRVRHAHFGNRVQLYFLMNAKSGICPEDCGYCSQSKISDADIPQYNLLSADKILVGARMAADQHAKTYCIVLSGRGPTKREMDQITAIVPRIKEQYPLKICACLGLLRPEDAARLKEAGVDRVNHNLNTGESHYAEICSTHTFQDRLETLRAVRAAGMELCSGGIVGMGESPGELVDMVRALRELRVESIPINFLNPVEGTPLAGTWNLNPRQCLKVLAMVRLMNPATEVRIAGGRELHLGSMQAMGLYAANSLFVGDYLTTRGQAAEADYRMIADLGFEITHDDQTGYPPPSSPATSSPAVRGLEVLVRNG